MIYMNQKNVNLINDLVQELEKNNIFTKTTNDAVVYKTSKNSLVDLNFSVSSMRKSIVVDGDVCPEIDSLFFDALKKDPRLTLKWLLYLRDVRHGLGEREVFRCLLSKIVSIYNVDSSFIDVLNIPEYGRWDDFLDLYCELNIYDSDLRLSRIRKHMLNVIKKQLEEDIINMNNNKNISLLAKWMPSESSSNAVTKNRALYIAKQLHLTPRKYRVMLSNLRRHLCIVETYMSKNKWSKIDYSKVPSKANLIYKNAFLNHDCKRRQSFLDALQKGSTKINSSVLYPHEIVNKYKNQYNISPYDCYDKNDTDIVLEEMWKKLPVNNIINDILIVRDGSGSMETRLPNSSATILDVADALTIYCSEHSTGNISKDTFITFSSNPEIVDLSSCKTLKDKLCLLQSYDDCSNTDIEKVFNLILKTAIKNHYDQSELPKNILIISDMQFDYVVNDYNNNGFQKYTPIFEEFKNRYAQYGYKMPKLIFWNLNQNDHLTVPLQENENGLILLSGYSTMLMNMVCSTEIDPLKALTKILNTERYDVIDKKITDDNIEQYFKK